MQTEKQYAICNIRDDGRLGHDSRDMSEIYASVDVARTDPRWASMPRPRPAYVPGVVAGVALIEIDRSQGPHPVRVILDRRDFATTT
jgi:hypothetical protein